MLPLCLAVIFYKISLVDCTQFLKDMAWGSMIHIYNTLKYVICDRQAYTNYILSSMTIHDPWFISPQQQYMQHLVVVRVTYSLSPAVGQIRTMPSNGGGAYHTTSATYETCAHLTCHAGCSNTTDLAGQVNGGNQHVPPGTLAPNALLQQYLMVSLRQL